MESCEGMTGQHYLGHIAPDKFWSIFEEELKKSGVTILCPNASSYVDCKNIEGKDVRMINKTLKINVNEENLITAAMYYAVKEILLDMVSCNSNCISIREPLHVYAIPELEINRIYMRYAIGKDIDKDDFKNQVFCCMEKPLKILGPSS